MCLMSYFTLAFTFQTFIRSTQINFYDTFPVCIYHYQNRYHCLYVPIMRFKDSDTEEVISYCLTECPYSWSTKDVDPYQSSYTFHQLAQKNITSQHLYYWSAPIDLIENYQAYYEQDDHFEHTESAGKDVFYNCTWPRFGSLCQYSFDHLSFSSAHDLSLSDIVHQYYESSTYQPMAVTCYQAIKCERGPAPLCLDWSEICGGKIDCIGGGEDEAHCWQLEVNECENDEYRCKIGQCIPRIFLRDRTELFECLDGSDEPHQQENSRDQCGTLEPSINCEDVMCTEHDFFLRSLAFNTCRQKQRQITVDNLFSIRPASVSQECWMAIVCRINIQSESSVACVNYCKNVSCFKAIENHCEQSFFILPAVPLLFGHLHLAYTKDYLINPKKRAVPEFNCINNRFCKLIPMQNGSLQIGNLTCYRSSSMSYVTYNFVPGSWIDKIIAPVYQHYWSCAALPDHYYNFCNQYHHLYQCMNTSKCISIYRVLDRVRDCFFGDDEQIDMVRQFIDLENNHAFFRCAPFNTYISHQLVDDGICDCQDKVVKICLDEYSDKLHSRTQISFQTMCDGFIELQPLMINEKLMTDETDCESWPCDNVYNRCDRIWNCLDGRDEVNCNASLPINCSSNERICVSPETNDLICLPIEYINDGRIDCIGASDERLICRSKVPNKHQDGFHCKNDTKNACVSFSVVCDNFKTCAHGDDEQCCRNETRQEIKKYFVEHFSSPQKRLIRYFSMENTPSLEQQQAPRIEDSLQPISVSSFATNLKQKNSLCHRGLKLRVHLSSPFISNDTFVCLCPPSFYGEQCQYQNRRVSLTVQFQALSDSWQTTFVIFIFLIDDANERSIHSVHQLHYLPFKDCQKKFNFNLLFSSRKYNDSLKQMIHFDIYEQNLHQHRASYLFPIHFPFLPVYRLALQLPIPTRFEDDSRSVKHFCTDIDCGKHGGCRHYDRVSSYSSLSSNSTAYFCQCDQGWSGKYCNISITCACSPSALCLGNLVSNHRSICFCPPGRFGPRCYLSNDHICLNDTHEQKCFNGGQCIPHQRYQRENSLSYTCLCTKGFTGDRCQISQTELNISFDPTLLKQLSQSILIHFVRSYSDRRHEYETTFKMIPHNHLYVSIHWSHPFHVVFIEFYRHKYYLAMVHPSSSTSDSHLKKTIRSSDRCPHVRDLLPSTLIHVHRLYRMKFYHLLCRPNNTLQIFCFYDDHHLCLCHSSPNREISREANCFEYDHQRKFDCLGQNACQNDGQCFQDNPQCPRTSMCICVACTYGRRCELTMDGFQLSLDVIIGYHIQPDVSIRQQPNIVILALILCVLMTLIGMVNGVLALLTFKNKPVRQIGCGYYLFGSAITTLSTMFLFSLKFAILLSVQMRLLTNRSFLIGQCRSVDFLLKVCLNLDQWLNACVTLDRAIIIMRGLNFNREKSKQEAKYIITSLLIIVSASHIYDPFYRRLIGYDKNGNEEEHRIWCIVSYSKRLQAFDSIVQMIHFAVPFLINVISAAIIIWLTAHYRRRAQQDLPLADAISAQLRLHKHILIAPLVIVVVTIPRLILSITFGCMKSSSQARLYLGGYFISFVPPMLTCVLIVFPSKPFRRELQNSMGGFRTAFQTAFVQFQRLLTIRT